MKSASLKAAYLRQAAELSAQLASLKHKNRYFVAGEIASFLAMLTFLTLATTLHNATWTLWIALACLVIYVLIRRMDVRNESAITAIGKLCQAYEDEARFLEGDFSPFDDGSHHADAHHPFALDLDIFGPSSLFHRLNRTVSSGGSNALAQALTALPGATAEAKEQVESKREAINELVDKYTWRMHFIAQGKGQANHGQRIGHKHTPFCPLASLTVLSLRIHRWLLGHCLDRYLHPFERQHPRLVGHHQLLRSHVAMLKLA